MSQPAMDESGDWRSPASEGMKAKILGRNWGDVAHTSLWYEIGEISHLTDEEIEDVRDELFVRGGDNIRVFPSGALRGTYVLRVQGKVKLLPAITIRGRYCPLYQYGPGARPTSQMVNFHALEGNFRCFR